MKRNLITLTVAILASAPLRPDDTAAQTTNLTAQSTVGFIVTAHPRNAETASQGAVTDNLRSGESNRFHVALDGTDPCKYVVGGGDFSQSYLEKRRATASYFWDFEVRTVDVSQDATTLDLTWSRRSNNRPADAISETTRLTLRHNERRPFDIVHIPGHTTCSSVTIEAVARIQAQPALADAVLDWDLWWVKDSSSPPVHTRVTSFQGDDTGFVFEPVRTTEGPLLQILGSIRGHVRLDGVVDVVLYTQRLSAPNLALLGTAKGMGQPRESGRKLFAIRPNEAVKIVLPTYVREQPPIATARNPEMSLTLQAHVRQLTQP